MTKKIKKQPKKPLTLETLVNYNRKVLKELKIADTNKIESRQREKNKRVWLIIIKALKDRSILNGEHLQEIAEMGIF